MIEKKLSSVVFSVLPATHLSCGMFSANNTYTITDVYDVTNDLKITENVNITYVKTVTGDCKTKQKGRSIETVNSDQNCIHTNEEQININIEGIINECDTSQICTPDDQVHIINSTMQVNDALQELKIMVWNINGLGDKLNSEEFVKYISNYDVIVFLETMKLDTFKPTIKYFEYKHFQRKFQHSRARKPSGGTGILIKSNLFNNSSVTVAKSTDFAVWLKIKQINNPTIHLGCVYIPPLDSTSTISSFQNNNAFQIIQDDISHFSTIGNVALCGDFNARTSNHADFIISNGKDRHDLCSVLYNYDKDQFLNKERLSEDAKMNKYGRELLELCKSSDMRIMNGYFDNTTATYTCYTANGKSLIDYLICDAYCFSKLSTFIIDPLNSDSDHRPLLFSFQLSISSQMVQKRQESSRLRDRNTNRYFRYVFDPIKAHGLINSLNSNECESILDKLVDNIICDTGADSVLDTMYSLLNTAISQNFKKKYLKSQGDTFPRNEWFDNECKILKRLVNDFSKNNDLNVQDNLNHYCKLKKNYRAITQKKKREYHKGIRDNLSNMHTNNPQEYWKFWDRLKKNSVSTITGVISLDSFEIYFRSIQCPPNNAKDKFDMQFLLEIENYMKNYDSTLTDDLSMTDAPISTYEVATELKNLKQGKAPGIDGISNEFYKYLSEFMLHPLTLLFNYIWEKGVYPEKWSEGIIQPLHKKGSQSEPDNYRKLTLMACMGKIFESILNKRLTFQTEATDSADPNQFGFCKGCRTSDNVFILDTLISYQRSKKKSIYITFVDFSKAFDFINRTFLYYKLINKGFHGRLLKIIRSLFSKASAKVRWEGQLGSNIESLYGVLQGGIISPKLFNLYLSDMEQYFDKNQGLRINDTTYTHLLYADDLVLISESASGMQILLDNLAMYCRKWHLLINSQKSKVMIIEPYSRKKLNITPCEFSVDNEKLEIVDSYKYLGHVISNGRKTHDLMFEHLASQAQRAMHALNERIKTTVGYLSPNLSLKMFDTHILPILEYNSEIWFPIKENATLEKIQLKFLKRLLGVRIQTSTVAILADTGKFPLIYRQQASAIKYWNRLKNGHCPELLKKCYEIQIILKQKKSACWLSKIYQVITHIGITDLDPNPNDIINLLFKRAGENLMADINDSNKNPKLRTYKLFKTDLRIEPYLNQNFPKYVYSSIARFRLSSHNLKIELGRHKRPYIPAEERLCKRCTLDMIEDEFHCLMICEYWKNIRDELIDTANKLIKNFLVLNPKVQFLEILTSKSTEINFALGKFLNIVLKSDNSA